MGVNRWQRIATLAATLTFLRWTWDAGQAVLPGGRLSSDLSWRQPGLQGHDQQGAPGRGSADGIDRYARDRFFWGIKSGTFMEVGAGAGNGSGPSSTTALEQAGWRGHLVEAAGASVDLLRATRPLASIVHATVCDSTAPVHFLQPNDAVDCATTPSGCGGAGAGVVEYMPDLFRQSWHPTAGSPASRLCSNGSLAGPECGGLGLETVVACTPLSSVVRATGRQHTNFLAIDVVGDSGAAP
jgi:hypothetical protein